MVVVSAGNLVLHVIIDMIFSLEMQLGSITKATNSFLALSFFVLAWSQAQKEICEYVLIFRHLSIPCTNVKLPVLRPIEKIFMGAIVISKN
jgi:hypothetical protein